MGTKVTNNKGQEVVIAGRPLACIGGMCHGESYFVMDNQHYLEIPDYSDYDVNDPCNSIELRHLQVIRLRVEQIRVCIPGSGGKGRHYIMEYISEYLVDDEEYPELNDEFFEALKATVYSPGL